MCRFTRGAIAGRPGESVHSDPRLRRQLTRSDVRGSIVWLSERDSPDAFPPVDRALREPDGLLAAGGDLSPARLLAAYRRGIFPWYSRGQPILWWCPDPRAVLLPGEFKTSRSLAKIDPQQGLRHAHRHGFSRRHPRLRQRGAAPGRHLAVARRCALPTLRLHELGYAHCVETWRDDRLVGGLYGVAIGRVFFGESMFSIERDASKIALQRLCEELVSRGFHMIDCQMATPHLLSLGAQLIPRTAVHRHAVLQHVQRSAHQPERWH